MRGERMAEVHLEEVTELAREDVGVRGRLRGLPRTVRRWWPVPVAGVLAAGAWQVASAAQDQAAVERLRETPGVVAEQVTPPLDATAWRAPAALSVLMGGVRTEDGLIAAAVADGDRVAVAAIEPATGAEAWRLELPTSGEAAWAQAWSCSDGGREVATTLWCVVAGAPAPDAEVTSTRLIGVDLRTRSLEQVHDLDASTEIAVAGDALVVASEEGGTLDVVATDLAGGAPLWSTGIPDGLGSSPVGGRLLASGGHVVLHGASADWALDAATGAIRANGEELVVARGGRLVEIVDGARSSLRTADGASTPATWGLPRHIEPDDGSAPDVLVLDALDGSSGGRLRALDADTGEVRWERPVNGRSQTNLVLLDGILYGSGNLTVWAVDAATGDEVWSSVGGSPVGDQLITDGLTVMRVERGEGSGRPELAAYALGTGERVWATALPEGVVSVWARGGLLIGQGASEAYALS